MLDPRNGVNAFRSGQSRGFGLGATTLAWQPGSVGDPLMRGHAKPATTKTNRPNCAPPPDHAYNLDGAFHPARNALTPAMDPTPAMGSILCERNGLACPSADELAQPSFRTPCPSYPRSARQACQYCFTRRRCGSAFSANSRRPLPATRSCNSCRRLATAARNSWTSRGSP